MYRLFVILFCFCFFHVFRYDLFAVPDIICLIKRYCSLSEKDLSDSVIPTVSHKFINYYTGCTL